MYGLGPGSEFPVSQSYADLVLRFLVDEILILSSLCIRHLPDAACGHAFIGIQFLNLAMISAGCFEPGAPRHAHEPVARYCQYFATVRKAQLFQVDLLIDYL
jgi:hypothetical protein